MVTIALACLSVAYGVVYLAVAVNLRQAPLYYEMIIPVIIGLVVAGLVLLLPAGEPTDQTNLRVHWHGSEAEFDALEDEVDRLAATQATGHPQPHATPPGTFSPASSEGDFMSLVRQAIDDLPPEFQTALQHVAVVISNEGSHQRRNGRRQPLYGLYMGYRAGGYDRISRPVGSPLPDTIVIFRDTLVHDFGHDTEQSRAQVTRTLRHELAHHLGWDEEGVRSLGL
ncbi:MAG: metallopeptidase family protein [Solirubrobacteraceae bacterium]